jgi:Carbon-nitrogen hydrolase
MEVKVSRTIKAAIVQLDVTPSPTPDRLARAERLIIRAAQDGAQLIALPEVFNTGYRYTDENFQRAEPLDGLTVTWLKNLSARLNVHLAGSILLRDCGEIYNALLLAAPDGQVWRYDKNYPWGWERAYFRAGHGITIAHTELGDIGLLICWDVAHPNLWQQHAGQVDLMLVSSCPPDLGNPTYEFSNGDRWTIDRLGPLMQSTRHTADMVFDTGTNRYTAWLGVPLLQAIASGHFRSAVPNPRTSLLAMLPAVPQVAPYLNQADQMQVSCAMTPACKIVNSAGERLTQLDPAQGEAYAISEIEIADEKLHPIGPPPGPTATWFTYLTSDVILPFISRSAYQRGVQTLPDRPPRLNSFTPQKWLIAIGLGALIGLLLAVFWPRQRPRQKS